MAVNKGVLVVMLWVTCQLGVSAQSIFPSKIGTPCSEDERCTKFIPNSICNDNVCACRDGYTPQPTNDSSCLRVATNIDDDCLDTIQCTTPFGPNAYCSNNQKCICQTNYHFVSPSSKCIESKGLNDTCTDSSECYLPDDGSNQHVICEGKQCRCSAGYKSADDSRTCKSSAATNIISITCLVGVLMLHLKM